MKNARRPLHTVLASFSIAAIALTITGCLSDIDDTSSSASSLAENEEETNTETVRFERVIDGDTIETSAGVVRIIGIDTPEQDECGARDASSTFAEYTSLYRDLVLELPDGQNNTDQYDRLLRYVYTEDGTDIGFEQISLGRAVARYDSRDGYPAHPKEEEYHQAQTATLQDGRVITPECAKEAEAEAARAAEAEAERMARAEAAAAEAEALNSSDHWWIQYRSCAALKRNTVGHPTGPFNRDDPAQAQLYDYFANHTGYRGDGDGDGLACE